MFFTGQTLFENGGPGRLGNNEIFNAIHEGRWSGKVEPSLCETKISTADSASLNQPVLASIQSNGLLTMRTDGRCSEWRDLALHDSTKTLIRTTNQEGGGIVMHHELHPEDGQWLPNSIQISSTGLVRGLRSTIDFLDDNRNTQIDLHQTKGGKAVSS